MNNSNGYVWLHLAYIKDNRLLTTALSCAITAAAALYCNAELYRPTDPLYYYFIVVSSFLVGGLVSQK